MQQKQLLPLSGLLIMLMASPIQADQNTTQATEEQPSQQTADSGKQIQEQKQDTDTPLETAEQRDQKAREKSKAIILQMQKKLGDL